MRVSNYSSQLRQLRASGFRGWSEVLQDLRSRVGERVDRLYMDDLHALVAYGALESRLLGALVFFRVPEGGEQALLDATRLLLLHKAMTDG